MTSLKCLLSIVCCLPLSGCSDGAVQQRNALSSTPAPGPVQITTLTVGARPKKIMDAVVLNLHDFHQEEANVGKWVCVEGTAKAYAEVFGAGVVTLACEECEVAIRCEGLAIYYCRIPQDGRIMIRGCVSKDMELVDAGFVSQQQIDDALKSESG